MNADARLTLAYLQAHPLEVVTQLEAWPAEEVAALLSDYEAGEVASVLEHAAPQVTADVLVCFPRDQAVAILAELPTPAAIAVLRQCEPAVLEDFLGRMDAVVGPGLRSKVSYPEGTAASLADPRMVTLAPDITVRTALDWIKRDPRRSTYYHYVLERDGVLTGMVTTKQLVVADPAELVATIMTDQLQTVSADAAGQELLQHPQWRRYPMLPVVDRNGLLVGVLRHQALQRASELVNVPMAGHVLSEVLIQVWEAYALMGLRLMTDLAHLVETTVTAVPTSDDRPEKETHDSTPPAS